MSDRFKLKPRDLQDWTSDDYIVKDGTGGIVATVHSEYGWHGEEQYALARFLAAAPLFLRALQRSEKALQEAVSRGQEAPDKRLREDMDAALFAVRDAIAAGGVYAD